MISKYTVAMNNNRKSHVINQMVTLQNTINDL